MVILMGNTDTTEVRKMSATKVNLTDEQFAVLTNARENGMSWKKIGQQLGCADTTAKAAYERLAASRKLFESHTELYIPQPAAQDDDTRPDYAEQVGNKVRAEAAAAKAVKLPEQVPADNPWGSVPNPAADPVPAPKPVATRPPAITAGPSPAPKPADPVKSRPLAVAAKPETPAAPKPATQPKAAAKMSRTDFYMLTLQQAVTATEAAKLLVGKGWEDEGQPKVTATLGYLVRTGRMTVTGTGAARMYRPVA
jgi:hypothetical protein